MKYLFKDKTGKNNANYEAIVRCLQREKTRRSTL
jgi:hypothetical protein